MSRKLVVRETKEKLLDQALELILQKAEEAITNRGEFSIALAGGSTPKPLYEKLAETNQDWNKWHIFWGDERFVPNSHPDSNERMARLAWLNQISIPSQNIHPLQTTFNSPQEAAIHNESQLKNILSSSETGWPILDIALLGMGDDGHTASLFPGTKAVQNCEQWVTVGMKGEDPRLTLTIPVFNHCRSVIFLIAGANKNVVLKEIWGNSSERTKYPIELIQPQTEAYWLLDSSAAKDISQ